MHLGSKRIDRRGSYGPPVCFLLAAFSCLEATAVLAETAVSIRADLQSRQPRPDAVLDGLASDDTELRCMAITRLRDWHPHVPGAMALLRRSIHDKETVVAIAAVEASSAIGSVDAFQAIVGILDRDLSLHQKAQVVDALDERSFRPYWRWSDRFGVRDRIEAWKLQGTRSFDLEQLRGLQIPEPTLNVTRVGRESMRHAKCYDCHRLSGYGRERGPCLDNVGECFSAKDLIRHIHRPSLEIHDMGRTLQVVTSDGSVLHGRPVINAGPRDESIELLSRMRSREIGSLLSLKSLDLDGFLVLRDRWGDSGRDHHVSWADIESVRVSPTSPMPEKLLDRLTPTEVADLLAFVLSNGGYDPTLPSLHHH